MTKNQKSLLLFLETCAVDHEVRVNTMHINEEDMEQVKTWHDEGFLMFGRIKDADVNNYGAHWIEFSEEAWVQVAEFRKDRAIRALANRRYQRTCE